MTAETTGLQPSHKPDAPGAPQQGASRLAGWALGMAIAALVLAVASPVWVPMIRPSANASVDASLTAAVGAATRTAESARTAADQASRAAQDVAGKAAPLSARLDSLETAVQALAAANATAAGSPDIRRLALAGAIAQLRPAVARPSPFAVEFAVVQGLAHGEDRYGEALRRLAPHAAIGVPTLRQLRLRFPAVADAALMAEAGADAIPLATRFVTWVAATAPFGSGQFIHELTMPATAPALARARARLEMDDLAGAITAAEGVTGPAAAVLQPWLAEARARLGLAVAMDGLVRVALADLPATVR